ncbi:DNA methyltransferase, partial [Bacillus sp. SIMBA_074]|uniref:DNA-methyltransferase n=1 Tax=Bacillus sp. SIMBA_074 TaxID=3085812 RepID=UPI00397BC1C8
MLNKIYNLNCLEGMNKISNESVDLLLTDPPYNVSMKSNFSSMGRTGVDFGEWDKGFNQEEWLKIACSKVKKSGSVVIFNDYKNIGIMTSVLESNGFTVKELILWKKPNPMPRNRNRLYVTTIEVALWAVKGKGWIFNRQKETYENAIFEAPTVSHKQR